MKQMTEYRRVSAYLDKIFNLLNEKYFENSLSKPVITIQSTPKAYGHVSVCDRWISDEQGRKELNIGAGTLNRPIEQVVATMQHEMVHIYCMQNGILDTSRGYTYHNKHFKEEAEKRALKIEHHPTYGWTITEPTDELIEFCLDNDLVDIKVVRLEAITGYVPRGGSDGDEEPGTPGPEGTAKKPSSTRKYACTCCGTSVRATKVVDLICGKCYKADGTIHYFEIQN